MTATHDSAPTVRHAPDGGVESLWDTLPIAVQGGPAGDPPWVTASGPTEGITRQPALRRGRIFAQVVAGALLVFAVVGVAGSIAALRLSEREAVNDASSIAEVMADGVIQPVLTDGLITGDPKALATMGQVVRDHVLRQGAVRVKIWKPDGTVIFSDNTQIIGQRFVLGDDQLAVLAHPRTVAEISDLSRSENEFDHVVGDRLLEVYRPVWTPSGAELLFEVYTPYDSVKKRSESLWRGFAGVTLSALLLLVVLLAPILWHLMSRLRRASEQRERLLERAVDASTQERKRIAATLHDGPVQELAATSFAVAATAERADSAGRSDLGDELRQLSGTVRSSMRALRSLLVDIYPPSLTGSGLGAALTDLAQTARGRGVTITTDIVEADDLPLDRDGQRLVHRVAQECLRNVAKHAAPCTASLALRAEGGDVVLEIVDDGPGFDAEELLDSPRETHFGLRVLSDLAAQGGGLLEVATAPGHGTRWRLTVAARTEGEPR